MELRSLLRILLRRWWVIIPVFLITVGSTAVLTLSQKPLYQSSTTLLVSPATNITTTESTLIQSLSLLARQSEIAQTYATLAASARIRQVASEALGLTPAQRSDAGLTLDARLVPGSQVIEIDVRSTDRETAVRYTTAVATALVDYVKSLTNAFELLTIDPATTSDRPVSPNVPLNMGIGIAAGLALALGVAVILHLLSPTPRLRPRMDIVDPETWSYSYPFFQFRLRQEMSRARRTTTPLAVALINVNHRESLDGASAHGRAEALVRVSILFDTHLRMEDTAARIDDMTFALLLPDTTEAEAVRMVEALRGRIASAVLGITEHREPMRANPAAGVVEYSGGDAVSEQELLERARRALQGAETTPTGRTEAFSTADVGRPA